jgi:hypothetical protein
MLIAIPTFVPLPYGKEIEITTFDNDFVKEMQKISSKHGFWVKTTSDVINQVEADSHSEIVINNVISPTAPSSSRDPACATIKGLRTMTFVTNQFVQLSFNGKSFSTAIPLWHTWRSTTTMKKSKKCTFLCTALAKIKLHQLNLRP